MFGFFRPRWVQLETPCSAGGLELHANGNFSLGPITFDQSSSLEGTTIGNVVVNKRGGAKEVLHIATSEVSRRFKFDGQVWWMAA